MTVVKQLIDFQFILIPGNTNQICVYIIHKYKMNTLLVCYPQKCNRIARKAVNIENNIT